MSRSDLILAINGVREKEPSRREQVFGIARYIIDRREKGASWGDLAKALSGAGLKISGPVLSQYISQYRTENPEKERRKTEKGKCNKSVSETITSELPTVKDRQELESAWAQIANSDSFSENYRGRRPGGMHGKEDLNENELAALKWYNACLAKFRREAKKKARTEASTIERPAIAGLEQGSGDYGKEIHQNGESDRDDAASSSAAICSSISL